MGKDPQVKPKTDGAWEKTASNRVKRLATRPKRLRIRAR